MPAPHVLHRPFARPQGASTTSTPPTHPVARSASRAPYVTPETGRPAPSPTVLVEAGDMVESAAQADRPDSWKHQESWPEQSSVAELRTLGEVLAPHGPQAPRVVFNPAIRRAAVPASSAASTAEAHQPQAPAHAPEGAPVQATAPAPMPAWDDDLHAWGDVSSRVLATRGAELRTEGEQHERGAMRNTSAVVAVLGGVLERVRSGALPIPGLREGMGDAAVLASVLTALLQDDAGPARRER